MKLLPALKLSKDKILTVFLLFVMPVLLFSFTLKGITGPQDPETIAATMNQAPHAFELSPERGRYTLLLAMAEYRSFEIPKEIALIAMPDVGYFQGKFYSLFTPGVPVAALPLYFIGKYFGNAQLGAFATTSIIALINGLLVFAIAFRLGANKWASISAALLFNFGSTAWSYAITFYQHHYSILCFLLSVYLLMLRNKHQVLNFAGVGLLFAISMTLDSPNAFFFLPILVLMASQAIDIVQKRQKYTVKISFVPAVSAITFAGVAALYGYYNYLSFGSWTQLSGTIPRYKEVLELQGEKTVDQIAEEKSVVGFFNARHMRNGIYTLLVSEDRGILYFSPVLILGLLGIPVAYRKNKGVTLALLSLMLLNIVLYSSWGDPWGGWAFGPRYLIPSISVLAIFMGLAITEYRNMWAKLGIFVLALYSMSVSLLGALTTNSIPPKIEAIHLPIAKYNYWLNLDYLEDGQTSSFFYNAFARDYLPLWGFYLVAWSLLATALWWTVMVKVSARKPQTFSLKNMRRLTWPKFNIELSHPVAGFRKLKQRFI